MQALEACVSSDFQTGVKTLSKTFPHIKDRVDVEAMARLTPYQVPRELPTTTLDWQPWAIIATIVMLIIVSSICAAKAWS